MVGTPGSNFGALIGKSARGFAAGCRRVLNYAPPPSQVPAGVPLVIGDVVTGPAEPPLQSLAQPDSAPSATSTLLYLVIAEDSLERRLWRKRPLRRPASHVQGQTHASNLTCLRTN